MSYARIVIDEKVLFDGELNQWAARPPEFIADMAEQMKPNSIQKPKTHMLALMCAFSDAMARQADIIAEVSTGPGWWTLNVKET